MKKVILSTVLIAMVCIGCKVNAQNCVEIVRPYLQLRGIALSDYPEPKLEWRCSFSQHTLFLTDSVPQQAKVFEIEALTNLITGEHPAKNHVVDLKTFSYWAWDFINFQREDPNHTVYFDTHNSSNRYLGVRTYSDAYSRMIGADYYHQEY